MCKYCLLIAVLLWGTGTRACVLTTVRLLKPSIHHIKFKRNRLENCLKIRVLLVKSYLKPVIFKWLFSAFPLEWEEKDDYAGWGTGLGFEVSSVFPLPATLYLTLSKWSNPWYYNQLNFCLASFMYLSCAFGEDCKHVKITCLGNLEIAAFILGVQFWFVKTSKSE